MHRDHDRGTHHTWVRAKAAELQKYERNLTYPSCLFAVLQVLVVDVNYCTYIHQWRQMVLQEFARLGAIVRRQDQGIGPLRKMVIFQKKVADYFLSR